MATYTPNYNLYKPAGTDQFDNFLTEFGNNMDIIDQNLGGGGGSSSLAGLSDVNLTSPAIDDALIYDGAEWVNSPLSAVAFSGDYSDLSNAPTIPTKTSDLNNDSDFVSDSAYVHTDNNFTNADVTKLSGIQAGAEVNVQSDWSEADNTADDYIKNKPTIPTKTSDLNNDSGFLDSSDITVTQVQTTGTKIATIDVDGNSTDLYAPTGGGGSYTEGDGIDITNNAISVDTTFTEASTRANINSGDTFSTILGKIKKFFTDLKTVAFSGSYNDLSNKPTIPTNTSDLNNDSGYVTGLDLMGKVDKSGDTMSGNLSIDNEGNESVLTLGNNEPALTLQQSSGRIDLWSAPLNNAYKTSLRSGATTANRVITFPDDGGTVALITDVATKVSKSGDTMTGRLDIKVSGQIPLALDRSHTGTTSQRVAFDVGNNIADGTAGSTYGEFALFGKRAYYTTLGAQDSTANRTIGFPDKDGTVALTSDVPSLSVVTQTISISALSPLGEAYDQDYSWSATYNIMGIVGYQLAGNNYTRCCFNRLSFRNGASKHVYYSIKNTSTTDTTGALTLTVQLLVMAN